MHKATIDINKYKNKGYTGLANLGNTCFLNSCVQVLNHTYELIELYTNNTTIKKYTKTDIPDHTIVVEWKELHKIMFSNNGVVSPNRFVHFVQEIAKFKNRELFTGWAQNDIAEFILFIVECMHNTISRSIKMNINGNPRNKVDEMAIQCYTMLKQTYEKEYSEIMDMFYGIYISELYSINTNERYSTRPESFFILDLPITDIESNTLYSCFDSFTRMEIMDGDNAWLNEKTNRKEPVYKRMTFWNLPSILIITLKRFSPDGRLRLNHTIDFPLENLNLEKYVSGYNPSKYVYDCYAICNHSGYVMGGHYTAFVKNASNQWIHYNDSNINIIEDTTQLITPMAYCLFYRKKNNLI